MTQDFILPDIGEGIVECEVVEWLVAEGDAVKEDQPICDVMTDKALVQIPAVHTGIISKLYYQKGDIAKVHAPLFAMTIDGAAPAESTEQAAQPDETQSTDTQLEDFILPDIGEGIVECEIVEWLVEEGQTIAEDQAVCDVMTDKALVQIPAKHHGIVERLYYQKGEIAKVHSPLFQMRIAGKTPSAEIKVDITPVVVAGNPNTMANTTAQTAVTSGKAVASPAVRRRARELDVNLSEVPGTGKNGRIYKEDVERYLQGAQQNVELSPTNETHTQSVPESNTRVEPIRGIKAAMAKQMVASVTTIPHFTFSDEIDLTDIIALRQSLKEQYSAQDIKLTMMPFFVKALSLAITEFPVLNSQVNDECTELTYFSDHNIGMAVDSKIGLLVPNIKKCQTKSIVDVAKEITRLTTAAREGRVAPDDLKGGTISISNIGAIGGTTATPIINKPEVAIVALGKVQHLPRFDEQGNVVSRAIMQVSWSGDHRVIDGGTIARFNNVWKAYLEQPSKMLMAMS